MYCLVPSCGGHTAPGSDVCPVHEAAERAAVAQHKYERTQDLAELYPERVEQAWRDNARRHVATIDRATFAEWDCDGTAYGIAAMRGIMDELARDAGHGRNNALNRAAFRLGRLVGGLELAHDPTATSIRRAGRMLSLPPHEVEHIVKGAFMRGILNPKSAPERRAA